jgi:hypothetical protein
MNTCIIPVQTGPDFRCFSCGAPAHGGHFWLPCGSPLDLYAEYIYYLRCPCGHHHRVARLGNLITPLEFVILDDFWEQIAANKAAIEHALVLLVNA